MSYSIKNVVTAENVPAWGNSKQFIAVHYLGVVGQNNRVSPGGYGAHYYIYWDGTIYQAADHNAVLWQVGTGGCYTQKHPKARNNNTIGIEMCCKCDGDTRQSGDKWYFTEETQKACVWLVQKLMKDLGIPASNVLRHYDIVNKTCPAPYVHNNKYRTSWTWDEFKAKISGSSSVSSSGSSSSGGSASSPTSYRTGMYKVIVDDLTIHTGPSTKYAACGSITDNGCYTVTEIQNTCWGKLKSGAGWICIDEDYCSPVKTSYESGSFQVYVGIPDLNIRTGSGTNYAKTGHYTGVGTFTIVEVKSGQGSDSGWGRLKSGAGWISLDFAKRV